MPQTMNAKKRRAFTLTELAIVMGVIGTIIGAIWLAAGNTNEARKENDAVNELQQIVMNIDTLMMGQQFLNAGVAYPDNTDLTSKLITAGVIPTNYVNATTGTTVDNPWSQSNFFIKTLGTPRNFYIEMDQMSQAGCVDVLSQVLSCQVNQSGCPIWAVTASGATNQISPGSTSTTAPPYSPTATNITAACAQNSYTGGTNYIRLYFGL